MKRVFAILFASLGLMGCVSVTYQRLELPSGMTLATHATRARYVHLLEEPCRHMTAMCPNDCDHGGVYAVFAIEEYMDYQQFGEYGEERQEQFAVRLWLPNGSPDPETPEALRKTIGDLDAGQAVTLHWNHIYRITEQGNFPVRTVTYLAE